jgi:N-acetylneuraminate synthase
VSGSDAMSLPSTYVIAEAGVNHNGSLDIARDLIDVAAEAGADAIKFQTFRADTLVTRSASKAAYQRVTTDAHESQHAMLEALELSEDDHQALVEHCTVRGVQFLSTPFDPESLRMLIERFEMHRIKVPSGEITNGPLLLAAARTGRPVILSTGMSTLGEVEQALGVLAFGYTERGDPPGVENFEGAYASADGQSALRDRVTVLHCTSEYPAPPEAVHLRAMDTLRAAFGLSVGYSDHTRGIAVSIAAVARGAVLVEKHFTLDRSLPGPDHRASLEPDELTAMVRAIRDVEAALGQSVKAPTAAELDTRAVARKSLMAAAAIREGEPFSVENVAARRPGTGVSPMEYWRYMGERAPHAYEPGDLLS